MMSISLLRWFISVPVGHIQETGWVLPISKEVWLCSHYSWYCPCHLHTGCCTHYNILPFWDYIHLLMNSPSSLCRLFPALLMVIVLLNKLVVDLLGFWTIMIIIVMVLSTVFMHYSLYIIHHTAAQFIIFESLDAWVTCMYKTKNCIYRNNLIINHKKNNCNKFSSKTK